MPCPPPLIGPPPPNHMAEMIMNKCAIECGKQRHGDGTMSPCPKHPHTGKGFWTAAGQFIPLEGWDQGKSSYANNFNVANMLLLLPTELDYSWKRNTAFLLYNQLTNHGE